MAACHASLAEIQDLEERRILEAEGECAADLNPQFGMSFIRRGIGTYYRVFVLKLGLRSRLRLGLRAEHQEIIHGLMTRDEVLSGRMARQHLEISLENRLRAIRECWRDGVSCEVAEITWKRGEF